MSGPEKIWRDHLAQGRLMLQRDPKSGAHYFPPRLAAPNGAPLEWVEARGGGTVYSLTVIRARPPEKDYHVALIDLDEGPRLMSRVEGVAPDEVRIGMRVAARIAAQDGEPLVVFHVV